MITVQEISNVTTFLQNNKLTSEYGYAGFRDIDFKKAISSGDFSKDGYDIKKKTTMYLLLDDNNINFTNSQKATHYIDIYKRISDKFALYVIYENL